MLHFSRILATLANGEILTILSQAIIGGRLWEQPSLNYRSMNVFCVLFFFHTALYLALPCFVEKYFALHTFRSVCSETVILLSCWICIMFSKNVRENKCCKTRFKSLITERRGETTPFAITIHYLLYIALGSKAIQSHISRQWARRKIAQAHREWWLWVYLFGVYSFVMALVISTVYI